MTTEILTPTAAARRAISHLGSKAPIADLIDFGMTFCPDWLDNDESIEWNDKLDTALFKLVD